MKSIRLSARQRKTAVMKAIFGRPIARQMSLVSITSFAGGLATGPAIPSHSEASGQIGLQDHQMASQSRISLDPSKGRLQAT